MTASFIHFHHQEPGHRVTSLGHSDRHSCWKKVAVLEPDCGMKTGERFRIMTFHPMNGSRRLLASAALRSRFQELLDGEPFERRPSRPITVSMSPAAMKKPLA